VFDLISRNMTPFLTAWGISLVAGFGISMVVGIVQGVLNFIPCLGQIAALVLSVGIIVYTSSVYAHLFGQFGQAALGQPQVIVASQGS
jgi:hypothetical protein